jgi:two-component system, NtrC family, sensor histidine kinase KinB
VLYMKWTLRKELLTGYGIVLILMIVVFISAFAYLLRLGKASEAILSNNYKSILAANNMIGAIERQDSAVLLIFLSYNEQGLKQFDENEKVFLQWLGRAKDNITEVGESETVATIDNGYSSYLDEFSSLKSLRYADQKRAVLLYHETILPQFKLVRDACERLREINQDAMSNSSNRARRISENAVLSMSIIGIVTLSVGIAFSILLSNRIVKPIKQIMEAAKKVSEGNYDQKVSITSNDEIGNLTNEFNLMIDKLKKFNDLNIEQILSEKQKSEAIIRSIDDGIIVIDTNYKIVNINPVAIRFLNIEYDMTLGRDFAEIVKDEQLFSHIKQSIESGQQPILEEGRNVLTIKHNEISRYYLFSITPVKPRANESSIIGVILSLTDVTHFKELDRLKSEFVMTASHELRTPLTSVLMSIDLLKESATQKLNERELELISVAHEEAMRFKSLVDDLLDLSKIEAGKIEMEFGRISIALLLQKAVEVMKTQAEEKSISLSFETLEENLNVKADAGKIIWVLTNLVANALRYTDSGGYIFLFAERIGTQAHISVADNGEGIPYEYQSRIFDKFVQVKSEKSVGGSGLGLSICREIIRAHGGSIWVESKPAEGSTFTFTLPIAS